MRGAHRHHHVDPRPEAFGQLYRRGKTDLDAHDTEGGRIEPLVFRRIKPHTRGLDAVDSEGFEQAKHEIGMGIGLDDEAMAEKTGSHGKIR